MAVNAFALKYWKTCRITSDVKPGTLVQRSQRWKEQFPHRETLRGMVVGSQSSWEGEEWLLVWWEGNGLEVPEYPDHVEPM